MPVRILLIATLLAHFLLSGCSSVPGVSGSFMDPVAPPPALPGSATIYSIGEEQAMDIAFAALEDIDPPREISAIEGQQRGFSTFSNSMGSRWFAAVYVFPVSGTSPGGGSADGYYLAASDDGNSQLAKDKGRQLNAALASRLAGLGGMEVSALAPSSYSGSRREYIRGAGHSAPVRTAPANAPVVEKIVVVPSEVKAPEGDSLQLLERLKDLADRGVITRDDYERKKREILDKL